MAGQKVVVEMDAEEARLVQAWQRGRQSVEEFASSVGSITPQADKADKATSNLSAAAEKWLSRMRTPLDNHLKRMAELQDLLQAGKIRQDQYTQGISLSVQEMREAEAAQDSLGQAAARIIAQQSTAQDHYNAQLQQLNQLRQANKLTEEQYAIAVSKAQAELDEKDVALQKVLNDADGIKKRAITPEEQHAQAIATAKLALDKKLITQKQYDNELRVQNDLLAKAKQTNDGFFSSATGQLMSMVGGYLSLQAAVNAVAQEQERFNTGIERTTELLAEEELKLQIQAGMVPAQVEAQMPVIQQALQNTPIGDLAKGIQIQTQLASSGVNAGDVKSGQALQETMNLMAVTNQYGRSTSDPKGAVKALMMFSKGEGIAEPGAVDIRRIGGKLTTLFEKSDIQFTDLEQLAKHASTLSEKGITESEQLAAFSTMVDVMGGEKGGTGLRGFVSRVASAGGSKEHTKALKELGLTPEDVDIAKGGDQLIPTLETLSAAFAGQSAERKGVLLHEIFGEENQSAAAYLLQPDTIQLIKDRVQAQEEDQTFERNLKLFQGSRVARTQRTKNAQQFTEREIDKQRGGSTFAEVEAETQAYIDQMYAQGDISGLQRTYGSIKNRVDQYVYKTLGYNPANVDELRQQRMGQVDQTSAYAQAGQADQAGRQAVAGLESNVVGELVGEMKQLNQQLRSNTAATAQNTERQARKTVRTPPPPRPSQALSARGT